MPDTPREEFERQFYRLIDQLPEKDVKGALGISDSLLARLQDYKEGRRKTRPISLKQILELRVRLLDFMDEAPGKYLPLH